MAPFLLRSLSSLSETPSTMGTFETLREWGHMEIKVGSRLKSAVCATEAVIVRAAADDVDLRCGGHSMISRGEVRDAEATPDPAFAEGSLIGKRYAHQELGLEVLVTKAGMGSLSIGDDPMPLLEAKTLPSSD
jgi:hypothetical protein